MSRLSRLTLLLVGALCLVQPGRANATTTTTSMSVSATVLGLCIVAATPIAFGNYTSTQTDNTGTVVASCTAGTPYNISLDPGTGTGASTGNRMMTGPSAATLHYSLYSNSGRTTNWGNVIGTDTVSGTGNGLAQTLTVYGRIPASQLSAPGVYTDTVTVTLTY